MVGATATLNGVDDEPVPSGVVTAIGPLVAPLGTVKASWVSEVTVKATEAPLSVTAVAFVKFEPVTVIDAPTGAAVGENEEMTGGGGVTVKLDVDDALPLGVDTVIEPVTAPLGIVAVICVSDETANAEAGVPANETPIRR